MDKLKFLTELCRKLSKEKYKNKNYRYKSAYASK